MGGRSTQIQLPDDFDAIAGQHSCRDDFKCTRFHFADDHQAGSCEDAPLRDDFLRQSSAVEYVFLRAHSRQLPTSLRPKIVRPTNPIPLRTGFRSDRGRATLLLSTPRVWPRFRSQLARTARSRWLTVAVSRTSMNGRLSWR